MGRVSEQQQPTGPDDETPDATDEHGGPDHTHTPDCGPAYFNEHGRWARLRHPRAWAEVQDLRIMRSLVREGPDSELYRAEAGAAGRRALAVFLVMLGSLVVTNIFGGIGYVIGLAALMFGVAPTMRLVAFRRTRQALAYRRGWLEGRQVLIQGATEAAIEQESPEEAFNAAMLVVSLQTQRDAEVVVGVTTMEAPDDLSGLDQT